jgi:hypothetical protein
MSEAPKVTYKERDFVSAKFYYSILMANASLRGKKLLAKISDEGAKANCFFSF